MNYVYNQMIWKKENKNKLVKFIFYREDKNLIIYEVNNQIFQGPNEIFCKATCNEIKQYYKNICDGNKQKIKNIKSILNRPNRKNLIENMIQINIKIKELQFNVNNLSIMNKLTNSNNLNLSSPKSKITNLKKKKNIIIIKYNRDMSNYKHLKQRIKNYKLKNSELKQERNKIINNLLEIKRRNNYD